MNLQVIGQLHPGLFPQTEFQMPSGQLTEHCLRQHANRNGRAKVGVSRSLCERINRQTGGVIGQTLRQLGWQRRLDVNVEHTAVLIGGQDIEHRQFVFICVLVKTRIEAINGNRSYVPSPPRSGEKVAGGRMRGLTGLLSIELKNKCKIPPHPGPLPAWKNSTVGKSFATGRGDNRKTHAASFLTA